MNNYSFEKRITDVWDYPKLSIYNNQIKSKEGYFDFLDKVEENNKGIRLYIHIPFCTSFCSFCQFYKEPFNKNEAYMDDYFSSVVKELKYYSEKAYIKSQKVTSIFWGGGDPSIIDYKHFKLLMKAIYENYNVTDDVSFSIEGNVRSLLDENRLKMYKEYGVNRISFGIQTFDEDIRKKLLLKPSLAEIDKVVEMISKINIDSFAFDLMYNLPNQTEEIIVKDIERATKYNSNYIDFYSLNLYPNTNFYKDIYERQVYEIKPDKYRELIQNKIIHKEMLKKGYSQVLSCTYSKEHDLPHSGLHHYLTGGNMLGIGPSARSFLNGRAFRNVCSVEKYSEMINSNIKPIETGVFISNEELQRRLAILSVTLLKIDKKLINNIEDLKTKVDGLQKSGYMVDKGNYFEITEEGTPWIGNVQKMFFSDEESSKDVSNLLKAIKEGRSAYNQDYMSIRKFS